ncbi:unnamed protein product [Brachionus calyciflorus]|uniref:Ubiquitin-like protease family profile domain-containing protein n=1 Tax=Brachionus calyciflorus TaxID=104777 RepID=A0A813VYI1_9BILA|nr:unnamed protein product [Brachionus calyciflorus]
MTYYYVNNNIILDKSTDIESTQTNSTQRKTFFEIVIPEEAQFKLSDSDWLKLKSIQKGHRFQRGEWEDYFVHGLKESNKYCVFAFKDHYVNQTSMRNRNAKMKDGGKEIDKNNLSNDKKLFSATGYCVFEDCTIKFCLKMNDKLTVHVFYTGKLKHCNTEINARHFRGKSRQELKEALKNSTPTREYLNRMCNSSIIAGNADYIGKTTSVYKKISAEAKDCYQSLIILRDNYIQKTLDKKIKGYIHLIQHIPGSIICFNQEQCEIYNSIKTNEFLSITQCQKNLISTTINSKNFKLFELGVKKESYVIPLNSMLSTEGYSRECLTQWLGMFNRCNKTLSLDHKTCYFLTDFSMSLIESVLEVFGLESFETYCKKLYKKLLCFNESSFHEINLKLDLLDQKLSVYIRVCHNQFLNELDKLLKKYYSFNKNYVFGMHAFSVVINSETLEELQKSLYSLMVILYNKKINTLVIRSFKYLKMKLEENEKKHGFYAFDPNGIELTQSNEQSFPQEGIFYEMSEFLFEKCVKDSQEIFEQGQINSHQSHKLLFHFIKKFSSGIPLWTRLIFEGKKMDIKLSEHYARFDLLSSNFSNLETIDGFIRKYEQLNESVIKEEYEKIPIGVESVKKKSILDILMNEKDENGDLENSESVERKVKNTKTELIKPKMSKKLKKSNDFPSLSYFNLVSLSDTNCEEIDEEEEDENEIVIERQQHVVSNEFGFDLTKDDLDQFESNSINSNLIQFYLKLLIRDCSHRVFVYSLNFYPNLKYGFKECEQSEDYFNLFSYEIVLIPIQKTDHWALASIDFKKQKIAYYDPLMLNDYDLLKLLSDFIEKEYSIKNSVKLNLKNWKIINDKNISKQVNLKDTGLFLLFYARRLVLNQELNTFEPEVDEFRNLLKQEIYDHVFK